MDDQETIALPKVLLQHVFDIATESMDFGSGFLDDEEQGHLRDFAIALGIDPEVATQHTHRCKYRGSHKWGRWTVPFDRPGYVPVASRICGECATREDAPAEMQTECVASAREDQRRYERFERAGYPRGVDHYTDPQFADPAPPNESNAHDTKGKDQ